jgi:ABC-type uncharacterized transport system YnjBCD substrate-binding protein
MEKVGGCVLQVEYISATARGASEERMTDRETVWNHLDELVRKLERQGRDERELETAEVALLVELPRVRDGALELEVARTEFRVDEELGDARLGESNASVVIESGKKGSARVFPPQAMDSSWRCG